MSLLDKDNVVEKWLPIDKDGNDNNEKLFMKTSTVVYSNDNDGRPMLAEALILSPNKDNHNDKIVDNYPKIQQTTNGEFIKDKKQFMADNHQRQSDEEPRDSKVELLSSTSSSSISGSIGSWKNEDQSLKSNESVAVGAIKNDDNVGSKPTPTIANDNIRQCKRCIIEEITLLKKFNNHQPHHHQYQSKIPILINSTVAESHKFMKKFQTSSNLLLFDNQQQQKSVQQPLSKSRCRHQQLSLEKFVSNIVFDESEGQSRTEKDDNSPATTSIIHKQENVANDPLESLVKNDEENFCLNKLCQDCYPKVQLLIEKGVLAVVSGPDKESLLEVKEKEKTWLEQTIDDLCDYWDQFPDVPYLRRFCLNIGWAFLMVELVKTLAKLLFVGKYQNHNTTDETRISSFENNVQP